MIIFRNENYYFTYVHVFIWSDLEPFTRVYSTLVQGLGETTSRFINLQNYSLAVGVQSLWHLPHIISFSYEESQVFSGYDMTWHWFWQWSLHNRCTCKEGPDVFHPGDSSVRIHVPPKNEYPATEQNMCPTKDAYRYWDFFCPVKILLYTMLF